MSNYELGKKAHAENRMRIPAHCNEFFRNVDTDNFIAECKEWLRGYDDAILAELAELMETE